MNIHPVTTAADHILLFPHFSENKKSLTVLRRQCLSNVKTYYLECAVNGMPLPVSALRANVANSMMDGRNDRLTLAHPYHQRKSCSKFG